MSGKAVAALIVAVALLAGGGSATAAKLITGKQIKDGSITGRDIRNNTVSVADLSPGAYTDLLGGEGPAGPAGPPGPIGAANIFTVTARQYLCAGETDCSIDYAVAVCPAGTRPVSGGGGAVSYSGLFMNLASGLSGQADGWAVGADNWGSSQTGYVDAFAYCASGVQSFTSPAVVRSAEVKSTRERQRAMHRP